RVIVLVATIGIGQLALTAATAYPKIDNAGASFPVVTTSSWHVAGITVAGSQLSILIAVPVLVGALSWFLGRTLIGKTVQASADNPDLARISGVNPKLVSTLVWAIAGLLSTVSIMLIAGQAGTAGTLTKLGPDTLVRALAAAVIGGLRSFRWTVVAALVIGVAESIIGFNYLDQPGLIDALILVAVLIAVWFHSRDRSDPASPFSFTPKPKPIPERLRSLWWIRLFDRSGLLVLG